MSDLHQKWPHRWVNDKIKVINDSKIEGVGIFANEKIFTGEIVMIPGGVIVPVSDLVSYKEVMGQVGIQIDDNFFLAPTSREEIKKNGAVNHSCNPNLGIDGAIIIKAIKDIEPGEECVIDYAFSYTILDEFECNCGSINCRRKITGGDWKISYLQEKYKNYFADFIKKKFL